MPPKRGDSVAPPPGRDEFEIKYATKEAVDGWRELGKQAPGNTRAAWEEMRTNPAPSPSTERHHQLKFDLATAVYNGRELPQWQIEVTGGGRVWYLYDEEKRVCWLKVARTGHPRQTDR
ncbi:hypothetical protein P8A18_17290 [Streptomyces castrisilvae]|uniref:Uncharacterized protein n=1 Tax=Streptomyces castrisilvae TaxID=3033811 RepID=A0ABY9HKJ3_9ACTN|nr:hypothetical protein [Streptomyces sp. Mut1]WLQ35077.1 hypothetical protein P8A18_17290 [Streptomyces sp. Mut1]